VCYFNKNFLPLKELTPKNRDTLEKLRAGQWLKIYPALCGTYLFLTVFARTHP
jgi:hypothetical protein